MENKEAKSFAKIKNEAKKHIEYNQMEKIKDDKFKRACIKFKTPAYQTRGNANANDEG